MKLSTGGPVMRRTLLIFLSLLLAAAVGTTVYADNGFYIISSNKTVPKTGLKNSYGPRDDGALQKGAVWPAPRFTDNNNGTVTDKLTGLLWMKNATALGQKNWADALKAANDLASGSFGLTDGSKAGDWRLPNVRELHSLIDYGRSWPAFSGVPPFTGVQYDHYYWSSTNFGGSAWYVDFNMGGVYYNGSLASYYVWCVRGGR